jgi:hypothetical protein
MMPHQCYEPKTLLNQQDEMVKATWGKIGTPTLVREGVYMFRILSIEEKVQHMKYIYDLQATRRKGHNSKSKDGPVTLCPCFCTTIETQFHHCISGKIPIGSNL